jgi:hypothetical protein
MIPTIQKYRCWRHLGTYLLAMKSKESTGVSRMWVRIRIRMDPGQLAHLHDHKRLYSPLYDIFDHIRPNKTTYTITDHVKPDTVQEFR